MVQGPISPDPGDAPEGWRELPPSREDWLTEEEWLAQLFSDQDEDWIGPGDDPQDGPGPDTPAPAGGDRRRGGRAVPGRTGGKKGKARAAKGTSRGPGLPGSARRVTVESCGPAGAFGAGQPLDTAPGGPALYGLAEYAAGDGERFVQATDDELTGIILRAGRRRPADGCEPAGPARMPALWDEFTEQELADALAETRWATGSMLDLVHVLAVKLPGTWAAFRAGTLRESKAAIIARGVTGLDPDEARAAEALVLYRAARLTPGGLRAAIRRAVIEVAPDKAAKRREKARQDARVERWPEESGNAGLAGRELPPADVFAADQRISWWAKQLRKAALGGDMDQLRACAFLDIRFR